MISIVTVFIQTLQKHNLFMALYYHKVIMLILLANDHDIV